MPSLTSIRGVNRTVFLLGLVSLFTDISSEMIVPLIPLFLGTLGVEVAIIGLVEGLAEGTANIFKGISGFISDKVERKKKLLVFGYGFSSVSKPIIAFATTWQIVLLARFGDRIGKGIRTSPRDHLLSLSVEEEFQGKAFGFHRAMDTTGAIVGAFMALMVLVIFANNPEVFRIAFLASLIPAIIAVIIIFFLKEKPNSKNKSKKQRPKISLPKEFKIFILVISTFAFVQVSVAFLILRSVEIFNLFNPVWWPISGNLRGEIFAIFGFLIYNIIYAIFSTSLGGISDRIGRIPIIVIGLLLLGTVLLLFAIIPVIGIPELVFLGMILFGFYVASTEGILKAFIADITKGDLKEIRGRAYGWYNLTIGLIALFSAVIFGISWDILGSSETFFIYAILVIIPILGFLTIKNNVYS